MVLSSRGVPRIIGMMMMMVMMFCPTEVFPEDSGNYTMTVKNQWGNASTMASLQVKGNSSFLERLLIIIIKGIS